MSDTNENIGIRSAHSIPTREDSHPGSVPSSPVVWPGQRHQSNQIQQTKGTAKAQSSVVIPTDQPSVPSVAARTTPQMVSKVRVVLQQADTPGQKKVVVQFNHPSADPYFAGVNVYLKRSGQPPVLVGAGAKSPITFTTAQAAAPHSIIVQSTGSWGNTDLLTSPAHPVLLR